MRTVYLFFYLLLSCALALAETDESIAFAEPPGSLSLEQALEQALNANAEIAVAMHEREAIQGMQIQASARPNPTLTARMEDTRSATRESFLEISQPIELGNKRMLRIQAADRYHDAASAGIALKKAEIQAEVMANFYALLVAQEKLRLAESSLENAQRARESASKRVQAGKLSPVEETRSRVAESAIRIQLTQAKSALNIAHRQLAELMGSSSPRFGFAEGRVELIETFPSLEQLQQQLDQAPALQRAKLEVDTRQSLVELEKTKATPDVAVTVGTKYSEELDQNQAILGLSVPIPLFDRNQGNIQEAMSRTDKARAEVEALRIQLETALARAHERLRSARDAATSYEEEILPGTQSAFEAISKGFEFGKFNFHEVLDAQRAMVQSRVQYLDVLLEAHQAIADIKRVLGDYVGTQNVLPQEPK